MKCTGPRGDLCFVRSSESVLEVDNKHSARMRNRRKPDERTAISTKVFISQYASSPSCWLSERVNAWPWVYLVDNVHLTVQATNQETKMPNGCHCTSWIFRENWFGVKNISSILNNVSFQKKSSYACCVKTVYFGNCVFLCVKRANCWVCKSHLLIANCWVR